MMAKGTYAMLLSATKDLGVFAKLQVAGAEVFEADRTALRCT
jgi:hypothetical protein